MAATDSSTAESATTDPKSHEELIRVLRDAICDLSHMTESVKALSGEIEPSQDPDRPSMNLVFRGLGSEGEKVALNAFGALEQLAGALGYEF